MATVTIDVEKLIEGLNNEARTHRSRARSLRAIYEEASPQGHDTADLVLRSISKALTASLVDTGEKDAGEELRAGAEKEIAASARIIGLVPDLCDALELILPLAKGFRAQPKSETARESNTSRIDAAELALQKARGEGDE